MPETSLPADLAAFERYVAEMLGPAGPVHASPVARELAGVVLRPPLAPLATLLPLPAGQAAAVLRRIPPAPTPGPCGRPSGCCRRPSARTTGSSWGPVERAVSAWLVAGWRGWRPLLPAGFRQMPKALAADDRVAGSGADPGPSATVGQ